MLLRRINGKKVSPTARHKHPQSHNGAIAATPRPPHHLSRIGLSIPQWCDCCQGLPDFPECADYFQSHNGAIAAIVDAELGLLRQIHFQSHNGAIAAVFDDWGPLYPDGFQSHNGAIAASTLTSFATVGFTFQSHNGAIAAPCC